MALQVSGHTEYNRMYRRSSRMLRGNERCDCGEHDRSLKGAQTQWLEDKYENRTHAAIGSNETLPPPRPPLLRGRR